MTIASAIQIKQQQMAAVYTECNNKGATMPQTQNLTNLANCVSSIPSGGGSSGKYQLLDRVKDDNNNEIGTVSGFFTDANDVEYAVVCLDSQYRLASGVWCSYNADPVTNLPTYSNLNTVLFGGKTETATQNTQLILDYCSAGGYTSSSCTHCRSKSFTINGITYSGQLPNLIELIDIIKNHYMIEQLDTSSGPTNVRFSNLENLTGFFSSNQLSMGGFAWNIYISNDSTFRVEMLNKTSSRFVCPVLEIPLS